MVAVSNENCSCAGELSSRVYLAAWRMMHGWTGRTAMDHDNELARDAYIVPSEYERDMELHVEAMFVESATGAEYVRRMDAIWRG